MDMTCKIWVVDDDHSIRWVLQKALEATGHQVRLFETADDVLDQLRKEEPDVLVSDIRMPGMDGLTLLAEIKNNYPQLPVIIMTAYSDLDSAVSVYEGGAFEYLPKPFDVDDAVELVQRAIKHKKETAGQQAGGNRIIKAGCSDFDIQAECADAGQQETEQAGNHRHALH